MPLVRIDLIEGKSKEYRSTIANVVYEAMRETMNVPENDRFMVFSEHPAEGFVADPNYLGARSRCCSECSKSASAGTGRSVMRGAKLHWATKR
jgi:phenylpyruvate tautomerase PptA (4-oxalocrotonate tautomerase family)